MSNVQMYNVHAVTGDINHAFGKCHPRRRRLQRGFACKLNFYRETCDIMITHWNLAKKKNDHKSAYHNIMSLELYCCT